VSRQVTAHPALVFVCPSCDARNIVCMAIAEINQDERCKLKGLDRELIAAGLNLLSIESYHNCWQCDEQFQVIYSNTPFYDED